MNPPSRTAVAQSDARRGAPEVEGKTPRLWSSWIDLVGLDRLSAVYLWILFTVVFGALNPGLYFTQTTFKLVFTENAVVAVLALAFLVPLAAGTYDLSIGAVLSFSLLLVNWMGVHTNLNAGVAAALAIAACSVVGFTSGFVVVRLHVNSFIATLGTSQIVTGLVLYISNSREITGAFSTTYETWGQRDLFGVPVMVFYVLAVALIIWYVLEHTPAGRYIFATGGNEAAARLAGVPTDWVVWMSLVASGALAGLAGVLYSMQVPTFSTVVGPGYLFPAATAVFFGASQFNKRPNVWGTLVAMYALAFGIKGLELHFRSGVYWIEPVFQGVALIFAVSLAARKGLIVRRHRIARRTEDVGSAGASE